MSKYHLTQPTEETLLRPISDEALAELELVRGSSPRFQQPWLYGQCRLTTGVRLPVKERAEEVISTMDLEDMTSRSIAEALVSEGLLADDGQDLRPVESRQYARMCVNAVPQLIARLRAAEAELAITRKKAGRLRENCREAILAIEGIARATPHELPLRLDRAVELSRSALVWAADLDQGLKT